MSKEEKKPDDNNAKTEEAQKSKPFEELNVDEKINVIAQNAISRQETYQRFDSVLEKIQAIAVRVENIELKQRLALAESESG